MLNAQSKRQNDCKANIFGLWGFQEQAAQKWGRNVRGPGVQNLGTQQFLAQHPDHSEHVQGQKVEKPWPAPSTQNCFSIQLISAIGGLRLAPVHQAISPAERLIWYCNL